MLTVSALSKGIKQSFILSPVLAILDQDRPFHVVCDANDFANGCALMQYDADDAVRVVCYQSRQVRPAERNYPVYETSCHEVRVGELHGLPVR